MRSKSGYTFIEVLLVIVIIGIIAAVAMPRFNLGRNLAGTTAKKFTDDLRVARSLAINQGIRYYLQFQSPFTEYKIFDPSTDPDTQIGETRVVAPAPEVTCTAVDDEENNANIFQFNYLGACIGGDYTITFVAEGQTYVVNIIGFTGRAHCWKSS